MRYYEIVFMLHPDCTGKISNIIDYYTKIITDSSGKVYRVENWGRRQLAYSINKLHKAYYILLNVKVSRNIIKELNDSFHFNDVILRSLIIRTKCSVIGPSPMMQYKQEHQEENDMSVVHQK